MNYYIYCGKNIGKVFVPEEIFKSFKQLVNHIYYDNAKYRRAPRVKYSTIIVKFKQIIKY